MSIQSSLTSSGVAATPTATPRPDIAPATALAPRKDDAAPRSQKLTGQDAMARARQLAADMEKTVRAAERNLQFQVDDGSGVVVVRVVDADSGDVIRQIPNEEFLRLARNARALESDVNFIVDEHA